MGTTLKSIIGTTLLFFSLQGVRAQKLLDFVPKDPMERSILVTQWMGQHWLLSSQQQVDLQIINDHYAYLIQPILESSASPIEKLKKSESLISTRVEETMAVLTKEQAETVQRRWILWKSLIEKSLRIFSGEP